MAEYIYNGFKVNYEIEITQDNFYQASASICCLDKNRAIQTQKFQTEYPSKTGVEIEIKRLIENYIDFEWKEFLQMKEQS